jgi:xylose isomerase
MDGIQISFPTGKGKDYEAGKLSLEDLTKLAHENGEPATISGKQEYFENLVNQTIFG